MKKAISIILLCVSLFSCGKKEKTKEQDAITSQDEDFLIHDQAQDTIPEAPAIFEATVFSKDEISVWDQPSTDAKKIGTLAPEHKIQVTAKTGKFEKHIPDSAQNSYGQWLKINYTLPNSTSSVPGYILDSYINYEYNIKQTITQKHISVKNEWEFLEALGSNTFITIEADTLNFDYYYKEFSGSEDFNKDTGAGRYAFSDSGSLQLQEYSNLTIKAAKPVRFIITKTHENVLLFQNCINLILDGFHFTSNTKLPQQGYLLNLQEAQNISFINTEFNGNNSMGILLTNSKGVTFNKNKFYNTPGNVITFHGTEDIIVKNSIFFENHHGSLIKLWLDKNEKQLDNALPIQFNNNAFINNNATSILGVKKSENIPQTSVLEFSECSIENNTLLSFINFEKPGNNLKVSFQNCKINDNDAADQDFIFISKPGASDHISFTNTNILNNRDNFDIDLSKITLKDTSINDHFYENEPELNGDEQ